MSLLTVAQNVADEVGLPRPSAVIGSTDRSVRQILRFINRTGEALAKKNWTVLQKENTFTTSNGTASYSLPSDYDRMLDFTAWDRTNYWNLRGPLSPREWQVYKSGLVANTTLRSRFRIKPDTRVNKFFIDPTPTGSNSMVFEYVSNQWVKDSGNSNGKTAYAVDTDISLLDESLIELGAIWRMLDRKGFAYDEAKDEFERRVDQAFASDGGMAVLNMGRPPHVPLSRSNIPEGGFG